MASQRCHTFSFSHYHQAPGASCSILYILVLSLVIFMQSLHTLSNLYKFSFTCKINEMLYWQLAQDTTFLPAQNLFRSEHALGNHYHFRPTHKKIWDECIM